MKKNLSLDTIKRYYSLKSHKILSLPILILMPHSRCNCRCVMCDIWKGNLNVKQLEEADIVGLLDSIKKFNTKEIVMSGGEALMHHNFFRLCEMIKAREAKITLLSTGLLLKRYATEIITNVNEVIVSLDGSKEIHNKIRNIPNAFEKLKEGVQVLKRLNPNFRITARCVIQKENFDDLENIIEASKDIGLNQISFLTADVTTDAFNRPELWGEEKIGEIKLSKKQLELFKEIIEAIIVKYEEEFSSRFIAESPDKFRRFYSYYAAFYGLNEFPVLRCNAPWVSAVVEADGTVRPCFFHNVVGDIRENSFSDIVNSEESILFRKNLDVKTNDICKKCVCSLNLSPFAKL
jgi:MoaA/NifB/PqqE/SkfB family radical SAM enzyme